MDNKKKIALPIKVIIIGCSIGIIFAGIGGIKQLNAKKTNEERAQAAQKQSEEAVNEANERLNEIKIEYDELKTQYDAKADECDAIITGSDGWFEKNSKCSREKQELQSKISALESEDLLIKNKNYVVYYQTVKPITYYIFYIIGGSIAFLALLAGFIIYLVKGKKAY